MSNQEGRLADIGLVGLGVMGQNLVLNMADHGFRVAVYNRTPAVTEEFVRAHPPGTFGPAGGELVPAREPRELVASLRRPRRIVILVQAGKATDAVIDTLAPLLEPGDILVDGGNAHWDDTTRREAALRARGLRFIGSGVSGGEIGARFGPSLMPGGDPEAWKQIEPVWRAISAKVDPRTGKPIEGAAPGKPVTAPGAEPCTAYIGPGAAGHYVKMVHNGIEYADMQLICEAYHLLREVGGMPPAELATVFAAWNAGDLDSYLIEITADILRQTDPTTGRPFVDVVLDAAGQKGTGKWTTNAALDAGVAVPSIAEAVFARAISAAKEERVRASERLGRSAAPAEPRADAARLVEQVRDALHCSKICAYAQGFALLRAASREFRWDLRFGEIAMIWRGGCIIRARFLQKIKEAFDRDADLPNLLLDPYFAGVIGRSQPAWRAAVSLAALRGIPVPAFASALAYFDAYRCARLPASLLQAQRDYFGAHTYERTDQPRGRFFHLDWSSPQRREIAQ